MINKILASAEEALADVNDGATILIGGFGSAGLPTHLTDALIAKGARDLTVVNNNAGNGEHGLAALMKAGCVRKLICSFPRQVDSWVFDDLWRAGKIELELVSSRQPSGANQGCRRRYWRFLYRYRFWYGAGQGERDPANQWS